MKIVKRVIAKMLAKQLEVAQRYQQFCADRVTRCENSARWCKEAAVPYRFMMENLEALHRVHQLKAKLDKWRV